MAERTGWVGRAVTATHKIGYLHPGCREAVLVLLQWPVDCMMFILGIDCAYASSPLQGASYSYRDDTTRYLELIICNFWPSAFRHELTFREERPGVYVCVAVGSPQIEIRRWRRTATSAFATATFAFALEWPR